MKAILLCGGQGTRLRPYTYNIPKPMLPLGRKPILEYVIRNLKANGVTEFFLTVGYLKERIMEYFGEGKKLGVKIHYVEEKEAQNTAGSILALKGNMKETFVVQMGDHLSRINVKKMIEQHRKSGCVASIGFKRAGVPLDYGIAHVGEDGMVKDFQEKPIVTNLINAGLYVFEPSIYDYIQPKEDFARNVFPRLLSSGKKINSYVFDDFWLDIGHTEEYEEMNRAISIIELVTELE